MRFRVVVVLAIAAALPVSACSPPGQTAEAAARLTTLGTITARLDGSARTWYVVGDAGDALQSSGLWHEPKPGERMITIAGFDTETPPFASFTRDAAGGVTSYGDYTGSLMLIILADLGANPQPRRVALDGGTALTYAAQAGKLDMSRPGVDIASIVAALHEPRSGTLDVAAAGFDGDRAFLEGTFSGTLEAPGGNRIAVTDGRFQARNLPKLTVTRP